MNAKDKTTLSNILADMQKIVRYTQGVDQESFYDDELRQDAIIMVLLTIGERVKNLSKEFKSAHTHIPWRSMADFRNDAAHEYDGLQLPDVWNSATNTIPALQRQIQEIVEQA